MSWLNKGYGLYSYLYHVDERQFSRFWRLAAHYLFFFAGCIVFLFYSEEGGIMIKLFLNQLTYDSK